MWKFQEIFPSSNCHFLLWVTHTSLLWVVKTVWYCKNQAGLVASLLWDCCLASQFALCNLGQHSVMAVRSGCMLPCGQHHWCSNIYPWCKAVRQEALNLIMWFCTTSVLSEKKIILYRLLTLYMYFLKKIVTLFYFISSYPKEWYNI